MSTGCALAAALVMGVVGPVLASWNPGDAYSMQSPQLPDPNGWDVDCTLFSSGAAGDDWVCTSSGFVEDIHVWFSWLGDNAPSSWYASVAICANNTSGAFNRPGNVLWSTFVESGDVAPRVYSTGDLGWYSPLHYLYEPNDHTDQWQMSLTNLSSPFYQEQGQTYWLVLQFPPIGNPLAGWSTSEDHHGAAALYSTTGGTWRQMGDPITGERLDMAFVIVPEPAGLCLLGLGGLAMIGRRRTR
jgi:hypothetical protein